MPRSDDGMRPDAVQMVGHKAIIVGIEAKSGRVEAAYVRHDGALLARGRVHPVPPGRSAVGEAITALGLTRFRRFPGTATAGPLNYARRLFAEMTDDAPQIL